MLYFLFKILQRLSRWSHRISVQIKVINYSILSRRRFQIQFPIIIGKRFLINSDITACKVLIRRHCRVRNDFQIYIGNNGTLSIDENCFFNNRCSINCLGKIIIGSHNQFGENVLMYDHNHQYQDTRQLISDQGYQVGSIIIGNNCWIGSNVVILKDVAIGDNVVIGAGCVIHKSIPANSVVMNQQDLLIKQRMQS